METVQGFLQAHTKGEILQETLLCRWGTTHLLLSVCISEMDDERSTD